MARAERRRKLLAQETASQMAERIHITTAIFYCNGTPHVGSAYEALAADVFARYQRRKLGRKNVSFLSGTDEHGDKIRRAALAEGLAPQAYTDKMSALFDEAFRGLGVSYDYWVRTTDEVHQKWVQEMLRRTHAHGDIYFRDYEGLYCVDCERFYTEKELLPGNVCPTHNRPVEMISEGNYFLRIEKYREQVLEHIRRNPDFIRPERYRKEALNMLSEPLTDLCISRPKARLDWGIELPFDSNYVTYVWYDAFWAYVSHPATNDPDFVEKVWPNTEHFIGKDILKTHAVYWPPILLAAGLPLFKHLNVHGWLNFGGARMSKSSGNVRDPVSYERAFGADVLRYFLMREVVYGLDGDFSEERIVERYNAELANDLGNLSSRVLAMAARYFQGEMKDSPTAPNLLNNLDPTLRFALSQWPERTSAAENLSPEVLDFALCAKFENLSERVGTLADCLEFNRALEEIWRAIDATNKYIVATSPFTLAKDPDKLPRVAQILANLLEGLRVIAATLEPFMPRQAAKLLDLLGVDESAAYAPFGSGLKPGDRVKAPVALFPRIDKTDRA
jgi:methionyl-tRNA synthetase